jgi:hypothetical protein
MEENWTTEELQRKQMETKANTGLIELVKDESVQSRSEERREHGSAGVNFMDNLGMFFQSGDILPPWWSTRRDAALSSFWKNVNVLSGAMYAMSAKMSTIPFRVEPRDMGIQSHIREAAKFERRLKESVDFGVGWQTFFTKQMLSLLGQDNGRFMEIIDLSPNKAGPVRGQAISVAHLDPSRCQRTGDSQFPVIYNDTDGKRRKLHYTRVAFDSQLPSERVDMFEVGFCAVGRSSSYGQNMLDIAQYKEEKLGSRPLRGLMVVGGGLDAAAVGASLEIAAGMSDNRGLQRFSMLPIVGNADIENPETAVNLVSLSDLPDGFSEKDSTAIAMAAISLAFGVDARELWPGMDSRATQADAILSHVKQRGKGPGQIIAQTETMFNNYFLPSYLKLVFDYQDDAQDRQQAEIQFERARSRKLNLENSITDNRYERQQMALTGEMSRNQFENLELENGRLPNGQDLLTLYFRDEDVYKEILTLPGISNPTDVLSNDAEPVLRAISKQRSVALEMLANETRQIEERQIRESLAALQALADEYLQVEEEKVEAAQEVSDIDVDPQEGQRFAAQKPKSSSENPALGANESLNVTMES